MSNPGETFPLIELHSSSGDLLDLTKLTDAGVPSRPDLEKHVSGLFLVKEYFIHAPAIGYVACLSDLDSFRYDPEAEDGPQALIGELFIMPEYRRQGHATRMVKTLTEHLFERKRRQIIACVANVSPPAAEPVFRSAGYEALPGSEKQQRVRYMLTREQWGKLPVDSQ